MSEGGHKALIGPARNLAGQAHQAFLLRFIDALRPMAIAAEIQETASRLLGEYLGADRVYYADIHEHEGIAFVRPDFSSTGMPSLAGQYPLSDFPEPISELKNGKSFVISDAATSPQLSAKTKISIAALGFRAFMTTPLVKGGKLVWTLNVAFSDPRHWTPADIELIHEIGERTWDAVERARAEEHLRADLEAMTWLQKVSALFLGEGDLGSVLGEIVEANLAVAAADFGMIQTLDPDGELRLAAHRNFPDWWVHHWQTVNKENGTCGVALEPMEQVMVDDITLSAPLSGTPECRVQIEAGVRAVLSTPLLSRTGKPLGILSTHWKKPGRPDDRTLRFISLLARQAGDILERAQTEEALRAANARLLEADKHKTNFLGVLSHELRNPLTPIKNSLVILAHAVPGSEQALRAYAVMTRQVDQLVRLIDDLLDITRITRNKIQLQLQRVEVNQLVERTLEDYRPTFEAAAVRLEFQAAKQPVFVVADQNRLAQVIGNLLQNAAKFTGPSGLVTVRVGAEGEQAVIQVIDTGIGFSPATAAKLFEPFMQEETSLDRSKGGLGLGLALVRGLVEQHGGTVHAQSAGVGMGATLTVRLPFAAASPLASEPMRPSARTTTRKVLIIEDNFDAADTLRQIFEFDGHQVAIAHSAAAGLEKAHSFHPEIVFCDIGLPGTDGYAVARAFRADAALRETPLIALSGYALPEDLRKADEAGFDLHIAKPPDFNVLSELLAAQDLRSAIGHRKHP